MTSLDKTDLLTVMEAVYCYMLEVHCMQSRLTCRQNFQSKFGVTCLTLRDTDAISEFVTDLQPLTFMVVATTFYCRTLLMNSVLRVNILS